MYNILNFVYGFVCITTYVFVLLIAEYTIQYTLPSALSYFNLNMIYCVFFVGLPPSASTKSTYPSVCSGTVNGGTHNSVLILTANPIFLTVLYFWASTGYID